MGIDYIVEIVNFLKYENGIVDLFLFCFETPHLLEIYIKVHEGKMIMSGICF